MANEVQMAKKHLEKCSPSLTITEMQNKTMLRFYHLTLVRLATIEDTTNNNCWQGCWKKEPSHTSGGNVNSATTMQNSMETPQKIKNRTAIYFSSTIHRDIPKGM
jgi:hypothetical protein